MDAKLAVKLAEKRADLLVGLRVGGKVYPMVAVSDFEMAVHLVSRWVDETVEMMVAVRVGRLVVTKAAQLAGQLVALLAAR